MRASRLLPDTLTGIRFPLTILLLLFMSRSDYTSAVAVVAAICLTDVLDGAAARALSACTRFGAYMDVCLDLFYVMASLVMLNMKGLAPIWFTVMTALQFIQFAVTSRLMRKYAECRTIWRFDGIGRSFSVLALLAPGIYCFSALHPAPAAYSVYGLLILSCLLAIASTAARIVRCGASMKAKSRMDIMMRSL
ncbi:MAG: CDP-alcohol phosphatidyltransferase family protein [Clostridia bacterium]|nr:CDP-alcohol phosphatidyltransferase family protein [Clostridia bacterium]